VMFSSNQDSTLVLDSLSKSLLEEEIFLFCGGGGGGRGSL